MPQLLSFSTQRRVSKILLRMMQARMLVVSQGLYWCCKGLAAVLLFLPLQGLGHSVSLLLWFGKSSFCGFL